MSQEKCVEIILNLFGYNSSDSLAIAKQILILIDTHLPKETSLISLIIEMQEQSTLKTQHPISEIALRQILATSQYAALELNQYARFQNLVQDYLIQSLQEHSQNAEFQKNVLLPYEILSSPILWVGGIEYENQKPGNFQPHLVEDFKNTLKNFRKTLTQHLPNSFFYESRTILIETSPEENVDRVSIKVSCNDHEFFQTTQDVVNNKSEDFFV